MKFLSSLLVSAIFIVFGLLSLLQYPHFQNPAKIYMIMTRNLTAEFIKSQPMEETTYIARDRVAVICFIGQSNEEIQTFLVMLYGSWRFINEERNQFNGSTKINITNEVDILAFCEPKVCKKIVPYCTVVESLQDVTVARNTPRCWAVPHTDNLKTYYPPLNSFVMFKRSDVFYLIPKYKYLLRSDYDVFVTPALLFYKPRKNLMFGIGGYSAEFNNERLRNISAKLGIVHRGVHSIGSTWFGETELSIKCGIKTFELAYHIFLNEFEENLAGLEKIDIENNPQGIWPEWWQPVSTMYGGDLALNHLIEDISSANKEQFDRPSCGIDPIWSTPHIHCWHDECEFSKYKFQKNLRLAINSNDGLPGNVLHTIVENMYPKEIYDMSINEYATHVAWNSVGRYLRKWFLEPSYSFRRRLWIK